MSETAEKPGALLSRPVPAPPVSVETQPFWEAAKESRFLIKRCGDCGKPYWYPRNVCPHCLSTNTAWEESPGEGEVYTFSIMRRSPSGPYAIGYAKLDEGIYVLTNFVGVSADALKIGMRVKVRFQETDGGPPVPVFGPI